MFNMRDVFNFFGRFRFSDPSASLYENLSHSDQSVRSQCGLVFIYFQPAAVSTMAFLNSIARLTDS